MTTSPSSNSIQGQQGSPTAELTEFSDMTELRSTMTDTSDSVQNSPPPLDSDKDVAKKKRPRPQALPKDDGYCSSSSTPKSSSHLYDPSAGADVQKESKREGKDGEESPATRRTSATSVSSAGQLDGSTVPVMIVTTRANHVSVPVANKEEDSESGRPTWSKKADFLLSIIGFAVDLANVWRFPYLCYRNGGGVFLIPYTIMLLFGALPLFYMELALGQYNRQGPISVWKICPLFKGVGYCAVLISWYVSFYYNVIIGWAVYFMVSSFKSELPWIRCDNDWNTDRCFVGRLFGGNDSSTDDDGRQDNKTSPAVEFFDRAVLEIQLSKGIHDLGAPKWQLVLCVFFVFIILYISLFKGVKSSGKVVWVTATAPYIILTILLIRGAFLPGAADGVKYYLKPEVEKLFESQVWVDAAVQVFYSVGVGFGVHLTYASYNKFHNNCYRDCIVTTMVNSVTSFYSGFVIFVYLGYMSAKQGVHISKVASEGYGLVFQVYPEAIATLPGGPFWAVLFFFMLLTLGLDSAMGGLESVITGLMDEFRSYFVRWRYSREIFTVLIMCTSFSIALVNVTKGGGYMMYWFDTYSAGMSLLCSALFESIGVAWIYGLDRFCSNIHEMLGFKPGIFWRLSWKFISPIFLVAVIVSALVNTPPLQYNDYSYPPWAEGLGWGFALSSVAMVPLIACIAIAKAPGTCCDKLLYVVTPENERTEENDPNTKIRLKWKHWTYI